MFFKQLSIPNRSCPTILPSKNLSTHPSLSFNSCLMPFLLLTVFSSFLAVINHYLNTQTFTEIDHHSKTCPSSNKFDIRSFDVTLSPGHDIVSIIDSTHHHHLSITDFIKGWVTQQSVISFGQHNPGLQSLLSCAGFVLSQSDTIQSLFDAIQAATFRLYEAKGRTIADAFDSLLTNQSSQKTIQYFKDGYRIHPAKTLRNLVQGTAYINQPLSTALKDYLGVFLIFQSLLNLTPALHTTVYRFGFINNVLDGNPLALSQPSPTLVSAAKDQALFVPSYFEEMYKK